jgi:Leucine-rich repeat (LRR) protein
LEKWDLFCSGLTGLGEDLEDSHELEELNPSNNRLSHSDVSSLKYIPRPWHSLEKWDLFCSGLTGLGEDLEDSHELEELNPSNNRLSHSDSSTLIRGSGDELKRLDSSGCGLTKLPEDLQDCHKLEELNLSNYRLSNSDISSLKYIP